MWFRKGKGINEEVTEKPDGIANVKRLVVADVPRFLASCDSIPAETALGTEEVGEQANGVAYVDVGVVVDIPPGEGNRGQGGAKLDQVDRVGIA
jgi:hypothetical protein